MIIRQSRALGDGRRSFSDRPAQGRLDGVLDLRPHRLERRAKERALRQVHVTGVRSRGDCLPGGRTPKGLGDSAQARFDVDYAGEPVFVSAGIGLSLNTVRRSLRAL